MDSPFPGMDPYLERYWGDVHSSLVIYARDRLRSVLPTGLRARAQERVFVDDPGGRDHDLFPDVFVVEYPPRREGPTERDDGGVVTAEPLRIRYGSGPITERFIEIIDVKSGGRVVTVVEVVSPSNKHAGKGRKLYKKKQDELRKAGAGSVEIDLLRAGKRVFAVPAKDITPAYRTTYQICVRPGWEDDAYDIYRAPLRERLPVIRIPLRRTDKAVPLDLQPLIDSAYENGEYGEDIDYRAEPDPPLDPDDAAWADELLRAAGRR